MSIITMELLRRTVEICISLHLVMFTFVDLEMKIPLNNTNNEFMNTSLQESRVMNYIYRNRLQSEALKFRPAGICFTEVPTYLLLCNKSLIRIGDGVCNSN